MKFPIPGPVGKDAYVEETIRRANAFDELLRVLKRVSNAGLRRGSEMSNDLERVLAKYSEKK